MKATFKILLSALLFCGCSQKQTADVDQSVSADGAIVVSAEIIDTGRSQRGREAFMVQAEVRNQSSAPVVIYLMTCSWTYSFLTEPDKGLEIPGWGCDSNVPGGYTFVPGGGFTFRFLIESSKSRAKAEGKKFKLGFIYSKTSDDLMNSLFKRHDNAQRIWTKELIVPKILDHVLDTPAEIKELTNMTPTTMAVTVLAAPEPHQP